MADNTLMKFAQISQEFSWEEGLRIHTLVTAWLSYHLQEEARYGNISVIHGINFLLDTLWREKPSELPKED